MTERRAVYNTSPLEDEFALQLQIAGIPFEREYRAINGRKYRWDFLVGSILVEIQGGTWTKGGHSTGKGLHRDYEKNNAAVLAGWRVLYFDGAMIRDGTALGTVQETMKQSERVEILKRAFPGIDGVSPESARKLNESTQILSDLIERTADMQEED